MRSGEAPIAGDLRIAGAARRSRPLTAIGCTIRKLPMKTKVSDLRNAGTPPVPRPRGEGRESWDPVALLPVSGWPQSPGTQSQASEWLPDAAIPGAGRAGRYRGSGLAAGPRNKPVLRRQRSKPASVSEFLSIGASMPSMYPHAIPAGNGKAHVPRTASQ